MYPSFQTFLFAKEYSLAFEVDEHEVKLVAISACAAVKRGANSLHT